MRLLISDKPVADWQAAGSTTLHSQLVMEWQDDEGNPTPYKDVRDEVWKKFLGYERPAWAK